MWERISVTVLAKTLVSLVGRIEKMNLTTKALEKLWKNEKCRLIWPSLINTAISFFNDCIKECQEARSWYEEREL